MEVFEKSDSWAENFKAGWLAHFHETGEINWKLYEHPRNSDAPGLPGIDLSQSRLLLITSSGAYLPDRQRPFDAPHPLGDYSIRRIPSSAALNSIAYAHTHYDHAAVDADPQVLVPLRHLDDLVEAGIIGETTNHFVSFMGYQPDVSRLLDEIIPAIIEAASQERATAALLVPA
jgi:hypothetical protein